MYVCQCPMFEKCCAPICPAEDISTENPNWFPDEPICRLRKYATHPIVAKQKRIKAAGLGPEDGYFTRRMLQAVERVTPNLRGASPEDGEEGGKRWTRERQRRQR
ncbi:MAG: hypothetical protein JW846_01480 [Dehalococcoidia bacterium]|nr:hypothetical protein [Dehalococcoidia bacterium]